MKQKYFFGLLFLATFLSFLLPVFLRFSHNKSLFGAQSYYELSPFVDSTPYEVMAGVFTSVFGFEAGNLIFLFILGMLSAVLFYLILARTASAQKELAALLLVFTPAFFYNFLVPSPHAMAVVVTLLAVYSVFEKTAYTRFIYVLCLIILYFFSVYNLILALAIGLFRLVRKKRHQQLISYVMILAAFSSFIYSLVMPSHRHILLSSISDLGGYGFGIFNIILFAIGLTVMWRKKTYTPFILTMYLLSSLFLLGTFVNSYLVFVVSLFAAIGLNKIYTFKWSMEFIKNITLLLILCGLLFSYVSFVGRLAADIPTYEDTLALEYLSTLEDGRVLSLPEYGNIIRHYAKMEPVAGPLFRDEQTASDVSTIFYSRNLRTTINALSNSSITYIYINPHLRNTVWEREGEGLLFLLRNNETFTRIYSNTSYEIWKVNLTAQKI